MLLFTAQLKMLRKAEVVPKVTQLAGTHQNWNQNKGFLTSYLRSVCGFFPTMAGTVGVQCLNVYHSLFLVHFQISILQVLFLKGQNTQLNHACGEHVLRGRVSGVT